MPPLGSRRTERRPLIELGPAEWRGYRRTDFPHESWSSEGGMLRVRADGAPVDLVSRRRFGDFILTFEWWLAAGANSGVLIRASESLEHSWQSAPELQLVDDAQHSDGGDPLTTCGALYGLLPPQVRTQPQPEHFLSGRLIVSGSTVEHWLDGRRVLSYDLADPALRGRITASKFAPFPEFATAREGHLVLQHHGSRAGFRRLRIET